MGGVGQRNQKGNEASNETVACQQPVHSMFKIRACLSEAGQKNHPNRPLRQSLSGGLQTENNNKITPQEIHPTRDTRKDFPTLSSA